MRSLSIQCALCVVLIAVIASMGPTITPASGSSDISAIQWPVEPWDLPPERPSEPAPLPVDVAAAMLPSSFVSPVVAAPVPTVPADPCAPTRPLIAPTYIKTGPKDRPRVAVTIDDTFAASGAKNVALALDLAKAKGAKLTFFPTGGAFDDHEKAGLSSVWTRVLAEGHEIGNHTYTHWNLLKLDDKDIQDELDSTQGRLDQILGFHYEMHLMRPPGGNGGNLDLRPDPNGPRVRCVVQRLGYSMTMWSIDSNGTSGFTDYQNRLQAPGVVSNGSIILLHFTTFSINNLSALMDNLIKRGFALVTVSQLFASNS